MRSGECVVLTLWLSVVLFVAMTPARIIATNSAKDRQTVIRLKQASGHMYKEANSHLECVDSELANKTGAAAVSFK